MISRGLRRKVGGAGKLFLKSTKIKSNNMIPVHKILVNLVAFIDSIYLVMLLFLMHYISKEVRNLKFKLFGWLGLLVELYLQMSFIYYCK